MEKFLVVTLNVELKALKLLSHLGSERWGSYG